MAGVGIVRPCPPIASLCISGVVVVLCGVNESTSMLIADPAPPGVVWGGLRATGSGCIVGLRRCRPTFAGDGAWDWTWRLAI